VTLQAVVSRLILLAGSVVTAFVVLELSMRMIYPAPVRFVYPQEMYDFDAELGHALRPGQTAFTHDRAVHVNSLGLRGAEVTPQPAPGIRRILALGDSQTFGNGLDLSDTWPRQLEQALERARADRWEVLNAGIPGTDTWQHEVLLRRLLTATHPHAVVLGLYVNDVVPRHDPRHIAASTLTNTWRKRLVYLLKRSAVVTWSYYFLLPWYARQARGSDPAEDPVLSGKNDARTERGWTQVEHSLAAMKDLCDARGVGFLLAILPRRDQVAGQHPGRAYNERALEIAKAHGIPALDLLPSLSAEYRVQRDELFIPWDGHNTGMANQVIAARLAEQLETLTAARPTLPGRTAPSVERTRQSRGSRP
jgi:lysophospholipase L1-like esterase